MTTLVDSRFLQEMHTAYDRRAPSHLITNPSVGFTIKPLSKWQQILHRYDNNYHTERLNRIASAVAITLTLQERNDTNLQETIDIAREVLHEAKKYKVRGNHLLWLNKEFFAAKLGITSQTMDQNPGFYAFASKNHLDKYIKEYQHPIIVDQQLDDIQILYNGVYTRWTDVKQIIQSWPRQPRQPNQHWVYGPHGIQDKNMYDWETLEPYIKLNPDDWGNQYVFEFCACINPKSTINGNHSWIRLKTPEGDVYSIGLYRPEKRSLLENYRNPLRIKPGYLMSPDVSEFWGFPIVSIEQAITKEDFIKMKEALENDKRNGDLNFQLINNNCVLYCKKIASIADIDLPTAETAAQFFVPPPLYNRAQRILKWFPQPIQKVCNAVAAFFINLLHLGLGGWKKDITLTTKQKQNAHHHLKTFKDLFDHKKTVIHFPQTLAVRRLKEILAWREDQIAQVAPSEESAAEIKKIQYTIPNQATLDSWVKLRQNPPPQNQ